MRSSSAISLAAIVVSCAAPATPPSVSAPRPAVAVVAPPPAAPPEDPSIKARADTAVIEAEKKLEEIERSCAARWFESTAVCKESTFEGFASDYQAYYAERRDPRGENARIDALTRLGGPASNVTQIAGELGQACADRCRVARTMTIGPAVDDAVAKCIKTNTLTSCKSLSKKMAATMRADEVEHWADECVGRCEDFHRDARAAAAIESRRPRTPAQAAACRRVCEQKYGGGWCGTSILACLGECLTKEELRAAQ